jgi:hypothetical protein
MNEILHAPQTISVYSDYSAILGSNIAGLAGCFVGKGQSFVKARKQYFDNESNNQAIYGEMLAVTYCLGILPEILSEYRMFLERPRSVILYSDLNLITNIQNDSITFRKHHFNVVANEIRNLLTELRKGYPLMDITVEYLDKERKRSNIFYKASHKAARRVIGK